MIFITGRGKRAIEDHFDKAYEMEAELESRGKKELLDMVRGIIPRHVNCVYIRQADALGLGHAVLCAANVIGNSPVRGHPGRRPHRRDAIRGAADDRGLRVRALFVMGVQTSPRDGIASYGIVRQHAHRRRLHEMQGIVEKPKPEVAPSNLAVVGRYILTRRRFFITCATSAGSGRGDPASPTGSRRCSRTSRFSLTPSRATRYDCGSKLGYMQATVQYGLRHPEVEAGFREYVKSVRGSTRLITCEQSIGTMASHREDIVAH